MASLALLAMILVPLALGAGVLRAIGITFASDRLAYFGWAWLAGTLGTAAIELLWLLFGLGTRSALPLVLALLAAAGACAVLGRRRPSTKAPALPAAAVERAFLAFALATVLLVTAYRIFSSSLQAIVENDEAIFWSYRAKLLFQSGGFGVEYATGLAQQRPPNGDYPLLNPLLQLWAFVLAGRVTDVVNRVPIQLVSLALVLCLAAGLSRLTRPAVAALLLFLPFRWHELASAARHAHSDVLVAFGLVVALDAYLRWRAQGRRCWIALASLGVTFALGAKHDGELHVLAFLAAALVLGHARLRRPDEWIRPAKLGWCLPPLAVLAFTWAHNAWFDVRNSYMTGAHTDVAFPVVLWRQLGERLPGVCAFFWSEVVLEPNTNYVLLAVPLLALLAPRSLWRGPAGIPVLAFFFSCAGMVLIFVGLPYDLDWSLRVAAARVAVQVMPAAVVLLAALAAEHSERLRPAPERTSSPPGREPLHDA